jgi:polyhydroxybutyrate depolymerase
MAGVVSNRILSVMVVASVASSACGSSAQRSEGPSDEPSGSSRAGSGSGSGAQGGSNGGSSIGSNDGSGPSGGGAATGSDDEGERDVIRSAGCGRAPALESGAQSVDVDGLTRTFILDRPSDYDPDMAYPLLFGFHGRGFSGAEFRSADYADLLSVAGDVAIVVYPDALGEGERAWDTESAQDVRFFDALLDELSEGSCVDESRVFATGHSSGGYFVNVLGCQRGDALRAIAPVAGGGPFGSDGDAPNCAGPISAWVAHAEDDETVPFENGENSRDFWLESDGCDRDDVDDVTPAPCVGYGGCGAGLAVDWCVYEGGHDWPSFGARGVWDFFTRF